MVVWILIAVGVVVVIVGVGIVASVMLHQPSARPPLSSEGSGGARGETRDARVGLEKFKCQECGAELGQDDIAVKEGIAFVSCSYCGSTYQVVEEPK